jgi:DNA segregation ATPase FtsK/SpoIIIE, S-DNA-T family
MNYKLPDINLLSTSSDDNEAEEMESAWKQADIITDCLDQFGMRVEIDTDGISIGPQLVRFSGIAAERVPIRKLPNLATELQYSLGAESVSIEAPIPGQKFVGISVSREKRRTVMLGDVIHSAQSPLTVPLGISPDNQVISHSIKDMPHLLVGGVTGGGKSIALHSMICSLLMTTTPDELQLMLVDSKCVEMPQYEGIPNLITPVITDAYEAVDFFKALVLMMDKRYKFAQEMGARSLDELNEKLSPENKIPYILVVCDEIADLMFLSKHDVEESITRIAGKARAVGIHVILATQSPRREVISGLLKSNLPSRIGFSTSSSLDSRIIMDSMGCENLLGNGDMLFSNQGKSPIRLQSPLITSAEIESIVDSLRQNYPLNKELVAA